MQQIEQFLESHKKEIDQIWDFKGSITEKHKAVIESVLMGLDKGKIRAAEKINGKWQTNEWVKKAILLSFKIKKSSVIKGGIDKSSWYDKIDSKMLNWQEQDFIEAGFRAVPGCYIRYSAFVDVNVVLMPCFVNVGAYIGKGSLIDTWATVGSCAQIGTNCHISGGAGIGGVLEPIQANPVIIEDNCFIGARSEVAEGVVIGEGSVLSMGVYIGKSTKIIDRETGNVMYGYVPPYSVVVPGSIASKDGISVYAAIIVKKVDEQTRSKTSINELLRE
jgi:2,3,4,5-tetrahydropyridine-2,6-dicarboxylate N-succinyltransferase